MIAFVTLFLLITQHLYLDVGATAATPPGSNIQLQIPASFSTNQKAFVVSPDARNILTILKRFELDTHFEVVLLGDFAANSVDHLTDALGQLAKLAYAGSSLSYTKEKILFHLTLAKQLETPIIDILESVQNEVSKSEIKEILQIFEAYHHKVTSTRTLFVTHLSEPMFAQTYVSQSGYALLDIHPDRNNMRHGSTSGGDVKPILAQHDTLPAPSFFTQSPASFQATQYYDLAIEIYRSVEVLLPVPLPDEDTFSINHVHESLQSHSRGNTPSQSAASHVNVDVDHIPQLPTSVPTNVHLQLLTLCGYPLKKCQPDVLSVSVLESLTHESIPSSSHSSLTSLKITQSSSLLSISNSIPLMSAVLASRQRHAASTSSNPSSSPSADVMYFSPRVLLDHLSHAPEVIQLLEDTLEQVHDKWSHSAPVIILPVVSLLLPDHWEGLLSTEKASESSHGCSRGLYEYGPNMTRYGTTMSCHAFEIDSARGGGGGKGGSSLSAKRLQSLVKEDYLSVGGGDSGDGVEGRASGLDSVVHTALVLLRTSSANPPTTLLPSVVRSFFTTTRLLSRSNQRLARDATYQSAELYNAIVQVVWDYSPPHVFYSSVNKQIVTDYFWFEALAWSMTAEFNSDGAATQQRVINVNNANFNRHTDSYFGSDSYGNDSENNMNLNYALHRHRNFRQDSLFARLRSFQVVEVLLVKAARMTHLIDSLGGLKLATGSVTTTQQGNVEDWVRTNGVFVTHIQSFFKQMHKVATSFSDADYKNVLFLCKTAESTLSTMEQEVHLSDLRSSVRHAGVYLTSDGKVQPERVAVTCEAKYDYMNSEYGDEDGEEESLQPRSHGIIHAVKSALSSSFAHYICILVGVLVGVAVTVTVTGLRGDVSAHGSSRRKYHR